MGYRKKTQNELGFAAEERAVLEGHRAFVQQDGSIKVISDTNSAKSYRVTFMEVPYLEGLIHFSCSCPSGQNREHIPLPCKHAAVAARSLQWRGMATWSNGLWYVSEKFRSKLQKAI